MSRVFFFLLLSLLFSLSSSHIRYKALPFKGMDPQTQIKVTVQNTVVEGKFFVCLLQYS